MISSNELSITVSTLRVYRLPDCFRLPGKFAVYQAGLPSTRLFPSTRLVFTAYQYVSVYQTSLPSTWLVSYNFYEVQFAVENNIQNTSAAVKQYLGHNIRSHRHIQIFIKFHRTIIGSKYAIRIICDIFVQKIKNKCFNKNHSLNYTIVIIL